MKTFGFSAFLKLLSLNDKPQTTEIRNRFKPSTGGYDFHDSFRRFAHRHLVDEEAIEDLLPAIERIKRDPERLSVIAGLERLALWRKANPGNIVAAPTITFDSPGHVFRVKFEPDFGLRVQGQTTAIHLWNTKTPRLSPGGVYAAMTLADAAFVGRQEAPDDIAVLSMREPTTIYRLSSVPDQTANAALIMETLEDKFRGSGAPPSQPEQRPQP